MNRCPISYKLCGNAKYSKEGLALLAKNLRTIHDIPYTAEEQRLEASIRAQKMSIQGVQPKLSARLNIKNAVFEVVDTNGKFILKPQHQLYKELPQNEDLTMRLASLVGLDVPTHGMVYSKDGSLTYFIKRFDREGHKDKIHVEDFAQLAQKSRDTKYDYSMERLVKIIDQYCTFPSVEKIKLLKVVLFNFLIGNEDMHLKNYSIIKRGNIITLSPFYDLVNTTIILDGTIEEIALPVNGKKNKLTKDVFLNYYAKDVLELNDKVIQKVLIDIATPVAEMKELIKVSFLSNKAKNRYTDLFENRLSRLIFLY